MKTILPFVLILAYSTTSIAKDYTLTIHHLVSESSLVTTDVISVESKNNLKYKMYTLNGQYEKWNCHFTATKSNNVGIQCGKYLDSDYTSQWQIFASIHCDSKDSIVIDSLGMQCEQQ